MVLFTNEFFIEKIKAIRMQKAFGKVDRGGGKNQN